MAESVARPLDCYAHNVQGAISLLQAMQAVGGRTLNAPAANLITVNLGTGQGYSVLEMIERLSKNSSLIFQQNFMWRRLPAGSISQKPAGSRLHSHINQKLSF